MFFGPLRPRTTEALFGTLLPGKSANLGGTRRVSFYIIADDLQAHSFRFRQKYVYIERNRRSLYSLGAAPILEGPAERLRYLKLMICRHTKTMRKKKRTTLGH